MEIQGLSTTMDRPIYVFRPEDDKTTVFNAESTKQPLCLWYANKHYQALVGDISQEERANAIPGEPKGHRGGVGSAASTSKGSLGNQTRKSRIISRSLAIVYSSFSF